MSRVIKFWRATWPEGIFSNFFRRKVVIEGVSYATTEHYYQSKKFEGVTKFFKNLGVTLDLEEYIKNQKTPHEAAKEGRRKDFPLRSDWEDVKEAVMLTALRAKFTQHEDLKQILLETGDAVLAEDSPYDYYWGIGRDGNGKNRLGVLLMQVRGELQKKEEA
jgi:ribA/ribD-fused uncharacterized protein